MVGGRGEGEGGGGDAGSLTQALTLQLIVGVVTHIALRARVLRHLSVRNPRRHSRTHSRSEAEAATTPFMVAT